MEICERTIVKPEVVENYLKTANKNDIYIDAYNVSNNLYFEFNDKGCFESNDAYCVDMEGIFKLENFFIKNKNNMPDTLKVVLWLINIYDKIGITTFKYTTIKNSLSLVEGVDINQDKLKLLKNNLVKNNCSLGTHAILLKCLKYEYDELKELDFSSESMIKLDDIKIFQKYSPAIMDKLMKKGILYKFDIDRDLNNITGFRNKLRAYYFKSKKVISDYLRNYNVTDYILYNNIFETNGRKSRIDLVTALVDSENNYSYLEDLGILSCIDAILSDNIAINSSGMNKILFNFIKNINIEDTLEDKISFNNIIKHFKNIDKLFITDKRLRKHLVDFIL